MHYQAPVKDMLFVMEHLADLPALATLPGLEEFDLDTASAVLDESAKFCQDVVAPLNATADKQPSRWQEGEVYTSAGFQAAYRQFSANGWQSLSHPTEYGGQGLPQLLTTACHEMLHAANMSLALCPMLTDGAVEALLTAASPALRQKYVPALVAGTWAGTMNLTEPQAGSDLAAIRARAEPQPDGTYKVFGTKIFITYGEHDLTENIIHLVLARLPGAPEGVRGISLFVVPKFLVQPDGSLGARNDVQCVGIEHKLGIKASPTAVLQFGDHGGAIGELVGEPHRGLEYMFIMMNAARFTVGLQGVAICDRAYQQAVAYARERVQCRDLGGSSGPVTIIQHPDVKRMLLTMRASTEGARALAYVAAASNDQALHAPDATTRRQQQELYEFLVPVIKGYCTEMANDITSLGVQVHGGMGFVEDTGAAQHYRDARILAIYEGTTAIQANDFVGRKTVRDGGALAKRLCAQIAATEHALHARQHDDCSVVAQALQQARLALEGCIDFIVAHAKAQPKVVYAGAVRYLQLTGLVLCGWQMARALLVALEQQPHDPAFFTAKVVTARFFAEALLPQAQAWAAAVQQAGGSVERMTADMF
ncbi:acyl-CoA dehydrogenase [Macromonas bipunctata]|uniref:acyl-CoA dehydrogenase n=1 Tax=Macromonas bipunctata TaxID=183670 RepID=UPI000C326840|nr:acyl-CoA dehydrogenase [Macromonas bipunctata]